VVGAALKVLELISQRSELRGRLWENAAWFRAQMRARGFEIVPGEHPIVPVMLGEAASAVRLAERLLEKGIYVIAFSYPVVPKGKARIRVQLSAGHTRADLEHAVEQFTLAKEELAR